MTSLAKGCIIATVQTLQGTMADSQEVIAVHMKTVMRDACSNTGGKLRRIFAK